MRTLLLALLILLSTNLSCAATDSFTLDYSVSGNTVTILAAVTPYDPTPKVRDAFLHWFQRGFETALRNEAPLLVEWQNTPQGQAGQDGYELGLEKGERFRARRSGTERQTVPIPVPVR
ncbi:hypothetical protein JCM30471_16890 [Desulfuromonas carbonis]|uniref:hypothetical protein n=1 Tax=Desulfuromonas sp. DDH964 TaxID=1823759 RepID=UPI00078E90E0|nr:hypothetical protein [Desulfuromonas sp. DDH964]AMV73287.1 hypothetical protein DBW_2978 [Desulfuromonas sp. DDH964]